VKPTTTPFSLLGGYFNLGAKANLAALENSNSTGKSKISEQPQGNKANPAIISASSPSGSPLRALGTPRRASGYSSMAKRFYSSKWSSLDGSWLPGPWLATTTLDKPAIIVIQ